MKKTGILIFGIVTTILLSIFNLTKEQTIPRESEQDPYEVCGDIRIADSAEYFIMEAQITAAAESFQKSQPGDYVIPVAVHIIHNGTAIGNGANISDEQVYSAINALNEAYSKELLTFEDGNGATSDFKFALINKDDNGQPTTGIYRVNGAALSSTYASQGITAGQGQGASETLVKNWSRQNNQHAYNIWVVTEIENNNGGSGIQGYAYFPTTSQVDGTVVLFNAFGKVGNLKSYTNRNKTLAHEIGHALALWHTFQGGSCNAETNCLAQGDRVCDTDPHPVTSSCNSTICGGLYNRDNYMGYTNQTCKNAFTQGQINRASAAYQNSRSGFIISDALSNMQSLPVGASVEIVRPDPAIACTNSSTHLTVRVNNLQLPDVLNPNPIHKIDFEYTINGVVNNYYWWGPIGFNSSDNITLAEIPVGTDNLEISVSLLALNDITPDLPITDSITVVVPNNEPYTVQFLSDLLGSETSWVITEETVDGNVIYTSPSYPNYNANVLHSHDICLPDGCYVFKVTDLVPPMSHPDAYVKLIDNNGNVIVNANGNYGQIIHEFCIGDVVEAPQFEFLHFGLRRCKTKWGTALYFKTINDAAVDYYNVYTKTPTNILGWQWNQSVTPYGTIGVENMYTIFDPLYEESPTYYKLTAVFMDGSESDLKKIRVQCRVAKECDWSLSNGVIVSPNFNHSSIFIYDFNGNSVKNVNLQPGYYVLSLGTDGECKVKIRIGN